MTDIITDNALIHNAITPSTSTPSTEEEESDENDHQMKTEQSNPETPPVESLNHETKTQNQHEETLFPSPAADTQQIEIDEPVATDVLAFKFESKFKQILRTNFPKNNKFLTNNVWILNQIIFPTNSTNQQTSAQQCGSLKIRFSFVENELNVYHNIKKEALELNEYTSNCDQFSCDIDNATINAQFKNNTIIQRQHVHTLFATNFSGAQSLPLIIYPCNEVEKGDKAKIAQFASLAETPNGDLNKIDIFTDWLKLFIQQNNQPKCILINSFIYKLLFRSNLSPMQSKLDLIELCKQNHVYLLFYPLYSQTDAFNYGLYTQFKELWKRFSFKFATRDNPNSQLGFLYVYKQTMRTLFITNKTLLKDMFTELFSRYKSVLNGFDSIDTFISEHFNSISQSITQIEEEVIESSTVSDETPSKKESTQPTTSNATVVAASTSHHNLPSIPKHTEQELVELTEWINELSHIGSLCIKYTYLRDLHARHRPKQQSTSKELIANDNKWLELIRKIQNNLDYPNENDYMSKWYDINQWRQSYFEFIRNEFRINEADSVWTFDLIQFPYLRGVVHAPENDYARRPRNFKSKISVIFAFNAAGDYLPPFFVYPFSFQDRDDPTPNECYSHNGYITSRILETWLTSSFLPYLTNKQNKEYCLLYCGKLAVFDAQNLNLCNQNNIRPFAITDEKIKPFGLLFQKSARKRQTDLFLDSWKKVTTTSGVSSHLKCNSHQTFFNLFTDAFQNCIEETGNNNNETLNTSETELSNSQSTAVKDFKNKMSNSFEQCQLWPIKDEDYKQYFQTDVSLKQNNNLVNMELNDTKGKVMNKKLNSSKADNGLDMSQEEEELEEEEEEEDEPEEEEEEVNEDIEAEEEIESDFEPENKRRKVSVKAPKKPKQVKVKKGVASLADSLKTDTQFENAIASMVQKEVKKSHQKNLEDKYKKLISDLLVHVLKGRNFKFRLNDPTLKVKLGDKIRSSASEPDFIDNLVQNICSDSDFCSQSEENSASALNNSKKELVARELSVLLCNFYEQKK